MTDTIKIELTRNRSGNPRSWTMEINPNDIVPIGFFPVDDSEIYGNRDSLS